MAEIQSFLVPYDFSEHARAALCSARDLAPRYGTSLPLVNAIQPPHVTYGLARYAGAAEPALGMPQVRGRVRHSLAVVGDQRVELPGNRTHSRGR